MGRPINFDPQEKLHIAMKLFWERGYDGTSMQQLVSALGINRFSLYNCYGDKDALYHLVLDHYSKTVINRLIEPLLEPNAELPAVLQYLHLLKGAMSGNRGRWGCMVQNAGIERGLADERIQGRVDNWYAKLEALIFNALQRTQVARQLRNDIDPDSAAKYLVTVLQGIIAMRRSASDAERYQTALTFLISEVADWEQLSTK